MKHLHIIPLLLTLAACHRAPVEPAPTCEITSPVHCTSPTPDHCWAWVDCAPEQAEAELDAECGIDKLGETVCSWTWVPSGER